MEYSFLTVRQKSAAGVLAGSGEGQTEGSGK